MAFFFLPETYLPVLLDWKAESLRRVTGDPRYKSHHADSPSFLHAMKTTLPLPLRFFWHEPVVAVLGAYLVLIYILLFTFQSGFEFIFRDVYGLAPGLEGSCFGAVAAGVTFFTLLAPALYAAARRCGISEPEHRLWPAIVAAPILPISLFWLGWTDYARISIWAGLGACFVFGVVLIAIYVSSYEYIIDSYGERSSIALASITMVRYLVAGGMVVAARPMYEGIGVHWAMTLLGGVASLLAAAPLVFWWFGPKLRKRSEYALG